MSNGENEQVPSTIDIVDLMRPELRDLGERIVGELQNLREGIVGDIAKLQRASHPKAPHRVEARKRAIAMLLERNPKLRNLGICRAMDVHQDKFPDCAPLPSWHCRLWTEAYASVPSRVHVYISGIRRERR